MSSRVPAVPVLPVGRSVTGLPSAFMYFMSLGPFSAFARLGASVFSIHTERTLHRITSNNSAAITRRTSDLSVYEAVLHPDEGVQQAQAVNSAKKDATTARRAPAINRPRNVVTVPQNNVARAAHANQSYGDHRRKVGNSCSAPGARAETRDELCNSGCCYKPLYRDFLTTARSTCGGAAQFDG